MSRTRLAAVLGGLLALGLAAAGSAEGIPNRLQNLQYPSGPLIWISEAELKAEMAARDQPAGSRLESVSDLLGYLEGGRLDWSLAPADFEIAPDGTLICEPKRLSYYHFDQASDIRGLARLSGAIASVRVVASEPGIINGRHVGELLEVEVSSVLKDIEPGAADNLGEPPPLIRDGFYLFDFFARMVIDGRAVCLGTRQVPPGDYVLFLTGTRPDPLSPLPIFGLDGSALVAADGSFYGHLLDPFTAAPQDEIARQLAQLEQILAEQKP